jgi:hypothetical protein
LMMNRDGMHAEFGGNGRWALWRNYSNSLDQVRTFEQG